METKALAKVADQYYTQREKRLAKDRESKELKVKEVEYWNVLIENLSKDDATGVAGKLCRVTAKQGEAYVTEDWEQVRKWAMKDVARLGIFQERLNVEFIAQWMANPKNKGKLPPGVGRNTFAKLSVNKL